MANVADSFLSGGNIQFIEALYARWLEDPASVDASWRGLFDQNEGKPIVDGPPPGGFVNGANGHAKSNGSNGAGGLSAAQLLGELLFQSKVEKAVEAWRTHGHLFAALDPLGRPRTDAGDANDLAPLQPGFFNAAELAREVDSREAFPQATVKLGALLERLRNTYARTVGVEFTHVPDSRRRNWLRKRMEQSENRPALSQAQKTQLLKRLADAEAWEQVMVLKASTKKRFALDGGESLIPMLDGMLDVLAEQGADEVVIGMAHRGRLNVLINVMDKPAVQVFSEFNGPNEPGAYLGRGDVKYHMGFSSDRVTASGKSVHLSLCFNPSHLEVVNPVVAGRVRAKQDRLGDAAGKRVVPLMMHGDAAMAGQGVVTETFNLAYLPGYSTGGTIHIAINNQVGFTTDPEDGRSFRYCTGLAKILDIPVLHVNGDDPEACLHVMKLAAEYRQTFGSDVVVDLVCYRRFGHNEADDPKFTQPTMYALIDPRPKVRALYGQQLVEAKLQSAEQVEAIRGAAMARFTADYDEAKHHNTYMPPVAMGGVWKGLRGGVDSTVPDVETGLPPEQLKGFAERLGTLPDGFKPIRQVTQLFERRRAAAAGTKAVDWSLAEQLAYAGLLSAGIPVRMTGQDVERGTFTHRNAVVRDVETGAKFNALATLGADRGRLSLYNSPLTELAVVGFEYGYSLDTPDGLTIWEAQFGDFWNMAQPIVDQFLAASEEKWNRHSGLTLLLPHGYEGQGPEHSSARLERFLQLCGSDNLQVCYPTTAAQIFHLLRRQALRPIRKPLIVMTPKAPLRIAETESPLEAFTRGTYQRVIDDPAAPKAEQVDRVVLCSGKVFWDLAKARAEKKDERIALVRVEQLYPWPAAEVAAVLARYPNAKDVVWAQEEPQNMGSWHFALPLLQEAAAARALPVRYAGRPAAASPATGIEDAHKLELTLLTAQALDRGGNRGH